MNSLAILPPRPHALVQSRPSPCPDLSYWHQPHTSAHGEIPILFLHGIGVGLFPYMELLRQINQGRGKKDGTIGIIAVELLPVSSRLTRPMFRRDELCCQLGTILHRHGFDRFVVVSHSYGTVVTTHLLKTPELARRIASVVLVDPISILLNQPDVAYNFTARPPKRAIEWFLWYFGGRDIGVAHTLFRTFFWSENILWKEDLAHHRCVVFLGEKDSIVNAPRVVEYLHAASTAGTTDDTIKADAESESEDGCADEADDGDNLTVIWCRGLDHGQVFISSAWRARLTREILRETSSVVAAAAAAAAKSDGDCRYADSTTNNDDGKTTRRKLRPHLHGHAHGHRRHGLGVFRRRQNREVVLQ